MRAYRIRAGERLLQPDGVTLHGGDTIDLPDDLAAMHATRIESIPEVAAVPDAAPLAMSQPIYDIAAEQ